MNVNVFNNTIELTKTEAKAIRNTSSEIYMEFVEIRKQNPNFRHVIKTTSRRTNSIKGLTYDYMRKYITTHGGENVKVLMDEFNTLTGMVKNENEELNKINIVASTFEVKKWFLNKFPEFNDFRNSRKEKIQKIMDNVA